MNVRDYEYLSILGKTRSISKASQILYISQPALSKFLKKTEESVGVPLFQRVGKHLVPTYAGEQCLKTASQILFLHNQLQLSLMDIRQQERGQIKLGLPMSRSNYFISEILPLFYQRYPHVLISICEDGTSKLLQKLRAGELNMLFVNISDELPRLAYRYISQEEMVLAASAKFDIGKNAYQLKEYDFPCIDPQDWIDLPFLMLTKEQLSRRFADEYFAKHNLSPRAVMKIRNLGQVLLSVQNGMGVTICPSMPLIPNASQYPVQYYSLPGEDGPVRRKTAVVYREDAYLSAAEQYLIHIIENNYHLPK